MDTMDTKSHRINLTQKRKAENGRWQFYPVQWDGTKPAPRLIIIDEEPASWKGGGAFFLDWREGGKRKRKQVGKAPREALDGWRNPTGWLLAASIASCWALFVASRPVLQAGRAASEPHLPCSSVHRVLANAANQSRKTSRHS